MDHEQLKFGKGYDHTWLVPDSNEDLNLAAILKDPVSGRVLEIRTDQLEYNFMQEIILMVRLPDMEAKLIHFCSGLCLETQVFPTVPIIRAKKVGRVVSCVLERLIATRPCINSLSINFNGKYYTII